MNTKRGKFRKISILCGILLLGQLLLPGISMADINLASIQVRNGTVDMTNSTSNTLVVNANSNTKIFEAGGFGITGTSQGFGSNQAGTIAVLHTIGNNFNNGVFNNAGTYNLSRLYVENAGGLLAVVNGGTFALNNLYASRVPLNVFGPQVSVNTSQPLFSGATFGGVLTPVNLASIVNVSNIPQGALLAGTSGITSLPPEVTVQLPPPPTTFTSTSSSNSFQPVNQVTNTGGTANLSGGGSGRIYLPYGFNPSAFGCTGAPLLCASISGQIAPGLIGTGTNVTLGVDSNGYYIVSGNVALTSTTKSSSGTSYSQLASATISGGTFTRGTYIGANGATQQFVPGTTGMPMIPGMGNPGGYVTGSTGANFAMGQGMPPSGGMNMPFTMSGGFKPAMDSSQWGTGSSYSMSPGSNSMMMGTPGSFSGQGVQGSTQYSPGMTGGSNMMMNPGSNNNGSYGSFGNGTFNNGGYTGSPINGTSGGFRTSNNGGQPSGNYQGGNGPAPNGMPMFGPNTPNGIYKMGNNTMTVNNGKATFTDNATGSVKGTADFKTGDATQVGPNGTSTTFNMYNGPKTAPTAPGAKGQNGPANSSNGTAGTTAPSSDSNGLTAPAGSGSSDQNGPANGTQNQNSNAPGSNASGGLTDAQNNAINSGGAIGNVQDTNTVAPTTSASGADLSLPTGNAPTLSMPSAPAVNPTQSTNVNTDSTTAPLNTTAPAAPSSAPTTQNGQSQQPSGQPVTNQNQSSNLNNDQAGGQQPAIGSTINTPLGQVTVTGQNTGKLADGSTVTRNADNTATVTHPDGTVTTMPAPTTAPSTVPINTGVSQ